MAIEEDPPAGVPEWVVSFGDMMSLLLTFFIMLVSMSEMKKDDKFQAVVDSLREQFGDSMASVVLSAGDVRPLNGRIVKLNKTAKHQRQEMMRGSKVSGPKGDFDRVEVIRPGKRSGVGVVVYFGETSIELSETAKERLRELNEEIAGKPQKIEIRGHSSLRPLSPGSPFKDHWDLAFQRSLATMRFMVKELGVSQERIRVTSAGANEPVDTTSDSSETPKNARVEVSVLEEVISDLRVEDSDAAPAEEAPIEPPANSGAFNLNSSKKPAEGTTPSSGAVQPSETKNP
jgi:chemotaxis protein MotB